MICQVYTHRYWWVCDWEQGSVFCRVLYIELKISGPFYTEIIITQKKKFAKQKSIKFKIWKSHENHLQSCTRNFPCKKTEKSRKLLKPELVEIMTFSYDIFLEIKFDIFRFLVNKFWSFPHRNGPKISPDKMLTPGWECVSSELRSHVTNHQIRSNTSSRAE